MGIDLKTHKMLWGRSGNRCAFPGCRLGELFTDATETDDESLVGEECHIIAREDNGPRGDASFPLACRDRYANLILLCRVHHKQVDDQVGEYTVDRLKEMKAAHETWVRTQLGGYDADRQRDDELYADIVQGFEDRCFLSQWDGWGSYVMADEQPRIPRNVYEGLDELRRWLLNRIWPRRFPHLETAFENFRRVLCDFLNTFEMHADDLLEQRSPTIWTKKFYHIDAYDPERYEQLHREFIFHSLLVQDLMLELTRAANLIADVVRTTIVPSYRRAEGVLLVTSGPYLDMRHITHRAEYTSAERSSPSPYPGLDTFLKDRQNRDHCMGSGTSSRDPEFLDSYRRRGSQ